MDKLTKTQLATFDRVWAASKLYVNYTCRMSVTSLRHLTEDDLMQDCAIKLIELIRSGKHNDTVLPTMFKAAIWNMIRDIARQEKRKKSLTDSLAIEWQLIPDDMMQDVYFQSYVRYVESHLETEREKQMFMCLITPDKGLMDIVKKDHSVNLEKKHLAKRFKVSPATVSRFVQHLNRIAEEAFDTAHPVTTLN